jgi:hypothetical protein
VTDTLLVRAFILTNRKLQMVCFHIIKTTISGDKKNKLAGFEFWTIKQISCGSTASLDIYKIFVTVRIHLDETDENNGALKVIPKISKRNLQT